jgi:hypothetical protein
MPTAARMAGLLGKGLVLVIEYTQYRPSAGTSKACGAVAPPGPRPAGAIKRSIAAAVCGPLAHLLLFEACGSGRSRP